MIKDEGRRGPNANAKRQKMKTWTWTSVTLAVVVVTMAMMSGMVEATFDQTAWNEVMTTYVKVNQTSFGIQNEALVDYSSMRVDNDTNYYHYMQQLREAAPIETYTLNDQFAIAINAYNAFAIKQVLVNPCKVSFGRFCWLTASIRDISGLGTQVWDMPAGFIGETEYTLNELETFIRGLNDPRIHACIVCASASCPNIQPFAFTAEAIETQKNHSMTQFLSNQQKGLFLDETNNLLTLSSIFLWYQNDFETFVFPSLNGGKVRSSSFFIYPFTVAHNQRKKKKSLLGPS